MKITYSLALEMRMWTSLGVSIEPSTVSRSLFVPRSVLCSALSLEKLTMLVWSAPWPSSLWLDLAKEAAAGDLVGGESGWVLVSPTPPCLTVV